MYVKSVTMTSRPQMYNFSMLGAKEKLRAGLYLELYYEQQH